MNNKFYKTCAVAMCNSTTISTPAKLFIHVPKHKQIRRKWLKLARRDKTALATKSTAYFCEDHFDLPNDMVNYIEYTTMGMVSRINMQHGCLPSKFACQPDWVDVSQVCKDLSNVPRTNSDVVPTTNKTDLLHHEDTDLTESETDSETETIANMSGKGKHQYRKRRRDKSLEEVCEDQDEQNDESAEESEQLVMKCEVEEYEIEVDPHDYEPTQETEQLVVKCEVDECENQETQDLVEPDSESPIITTAKRKTTQMASAIDPLSSTPAPSIQVIKKENVMHLELTPLTTNYAAFGGGKGTIHTHKAKQSKLQQSEKSDDESISSLENTAGSLHVVKIEPMDDD